MKLSDVVKVSLIMCRDIARLESKQQWAPRQWLHFRAAYYVTNAWLRSLLRFLRKKGF